MYNFFENLNNKIKINNKSIVIINLNFLIIAKYIEKKSNEILLTILNIFCEIMH